MTTFSPIPVHLTYVRRARIVAIAARAWRMYGIAVEALHIASTAITPETSEVVVRSAWAITCANNLNTAVDVLAEEAGLENWQVRNDISRHGINACRLFSNVRMDERE